MTDDDVYARLDDALAEIERLRAEVESGVEDSAGWRDRCMVLDAEIERLRAVVCALVDTWDETPVHIDLYLARGAIRIDGPALDTVREALDTRETDR